jgi:hypothetical protein
MESSQYVLTSKQIVLQVQEEVLKAVFSEQRGWDESETLSELSEFLKTRQAVLPGGDRRFHLPFGGLEFGGMGRAWKGSVQAPESWKAEDERSAHPGSLEPPKEFPYWISIQGRSGFKRLHKFGECHYTPEGVKNWLPRWTLSEGDADVLCNFCWPEEKSQELAESEVSSGDSDSSSTGPD